MKLFIMFFGQTIHQYVSVPGDRWPLVCMLKSVPEQFGYTIRQSISVPGGGEALVCMLKSSQIILAQSVFVLLQVIKGDFHVVEYLGSESTFTEIVSQDRLRHRNTNPCIDANTFVKFEIEVPEEIREL